jgi:hypothetical protein
MPLIRIALASMSDSSCKERNTAYFPCEIAQEQATSFTQLVPQTGTLTLTPPHRRNKMRGIKNQAGASPRARLKIESM